MKNHLSFLFAFAVLFAGNQARADEFVGRTTDGTPCRFTVTVNGAQFDLATLQGTAKYSGLFDDTPEPAAVAYPADGQGLRSSISQSVSERKAHLKASYSMKGSAAHAVVEVKVSGDVASNQLEEVQMTESIWTLLFVRVNEKTIDCKDLVRQ